VCARARACAYKKEVENRKKIYKFEIIEEYKNIKTSVKRE
jgi:hypothetical protein